MSITLIIKPINPELFNQATLKPLAECLSDEINKRKMFSGYVEGFSVSIRENHFEVSFLGITLANSKSGNYFLRRFAGILDYLGLKPFIFISNMEDTQVAQDKIFDCEAFNPKYTSNSKLLASLNMQEEKIPSDYLCSIGMVVMDNPVFIKGKPDLKYDREYLEYWLFQQDKFIDPFRKVSIVLDDILEDHELREQLRKFMASSMRGALEEQVRARKEEAALTRLTQEYKLPDRTDKSLEIGLRRSAAVRNVSDVSFFITKVKNVNGKDDNPTSQKSALHWAVLKKSVPCTRALLRAGADADLQDAKGNSPYQDAQTLDADVLALLTAAKTEKALKEHFLYFEARALEMILDYSVTERLSTPKL